MKIAFYAPMKSPRHARPSGDRRIARLFIQALTMAGCEVELASELRAWNGDGDRRRQAEIASDARRAAAALIEKYHAQPSHRPHCWFTYHLYHKAPDWIGPAVCDALNIPYIVAEASVAAKQRHGRWRDGYAQSVAAVQQARLIFNLNSNDLAGVREHVNRSCNLVALKPFMEAPAAATAKEKLRDDIAAQSGVAKKNFWLVCVAMMRADSKLKSYRVLADAAARIKRDDWRLLIAGDGPAAATVTALFGGDLHDRVHFFGNRDADFIRALMRAGDLLVWPAVGEAFGMAALEALACGLPVVAGDDGGGIGGVVAHGVTGVLVKPDARALAAAVDALLADPDKREWMSAASLDVFDRDHRLDHASKKIGAALAAL